jgi:PadR family transcriptional regulator, regulatory protein PadR
MSELLRGHLDPLLLAVLETGPLHGYAIIEELRSRSGGSFDLPEGTVYPALHRLERERLVASALATVNGRQRRVYRLTRRGERALDERRTEWRSFSMTVTAMLRTRPA